jgi:hypothetical protein
MLAIRGAVRELCQQGRQLVAEQFLPSATDVDAGKLHHDRPGNR